MSAPLSTGGSLEPQHYRSSSILYGQNWAHGLSLERRSKQLASLVTRGEQLWNARIGATQGPDTDRRILEAVYKIVRIVNCELNAQLSHQQGAAANNTSIQPRGDVEANVDATLFLANIGLATMQELGQVDQFMSLLIPLCQHFESGLFNGYKERQRATLEVARSELVRRSFSLFSAIFVRMTETERSNPLHRLGFDIEIISRSLSKISTDLIKAFCAALYWSSLEIADSSWLFSSIREVIANFGEYNPLERTWKRAAALRGVIEFLLSERAAALEADPQFGSVIALCMKKYLFQCSNILLMPDACANNLSY